MNQSRAFALAMIVLLVVPAGDLPLFSGVPLKNGPELVALLLILPLLASRRVRSAVAAKLGPSTRRRTLVVGLLLVLVLASKLALLATGAKVGWEACYHPVGAIQVASGCERSYDNPLFLEHSTRLDTQLNFGAIGSEEPSGGISRSNWNLTFFNSLRWNDLQPRDYRERLPFSVTWKASADSEGTIAVSYVGEGTVAVGGRVAHLSPAYVHPRSVAIGGWPRRGMAVIRFEFNPPAGVALTGPYAMFRLQHMRAAGPSLAERVVSWLVDLPFFLLLLWLAVGYARVATRGEWAMVAAVILVLCPEALNVVHERTIPTVIASTLVLAAVVLRPSWRRLLFAVWTVVLINVVCNLAVADWHAVVYRAAGDDWLGYESFARSILDTGSLRGGESVFVSQPAIRYVIFATRAIFGDSDTLFSAVAFAAVELGVIIAVAVACASITGRPRARFVCFVMGACLLVALNEPLIGQFMQFPASEAPVWVCLPPGVALVLFARDRRWLLAGTVALAVCAVSRAELVPAVSLLFAVGLLRWRRRDRTWVVACLAVYLGVVALPLAHNILYAGRVVPFTHDVPGNVSLPASNWPNVFTNHRIWALAEHQLRAVFYASPEATSTRVLVWLTLMQLSWLLALVSTLIHWRRTLWTTRTLMITPLVALAPFVVYDVFNYYPRHIIAGHMLMALAVIMTMGLERSWLVGPLDFRSLAHRVSRRPAQAIGRSA